MVAKSFTNNSATNNGLGKSRGRTHDAASSGPSYSLPNLSDSRRCLCLALVALVYALLAGCRTLTDTDLGWQLATGRWLVQHHQIPSVDVFSYTASGQPWIYPVGWGLSSTPFTRLAIMLSCRGSSHSVCRNSCLAPPARFMGNGGAGDFGGPRIALRTTPRAEIFSVVSLAAFLTILWEHYETGRARLWLLPLMMVAWVNLHLGLTAGLGLLVGYVFLECTEMIWAGASSTRHRQASPGVAMVSRHNRRDADQSLGMGGVRSHEQSDGTHDESVTVD